MVKQVIVILFLLQSICIFSSQQELSSDFEQHDDAIEAKILDLSTYPRLQLFLAARSLCTLSDNKASMLDIKALQLQSDNLYWQKQRHIKTIETIWQIHTIPGRPGIYGYCRICNVINDRYNYDKDNER